MTRQTPESRRMLAALVAECEADRRTAASAWLLGMIPKEEQIEVARLAVEIAVAAQATVPTASPCQETPSTAPGLADDLRAVWNATLDYLKETALLEDLSAMIKDAGGALGEPIREAQDRVARKTVEMADLVKGAAARNAEWTASAARNYLVCKAMDVQDALRVAINMIRDAEIPLPGTAVIPHNGEAAAKPVPPPPPPPPEKLSAAPPTGGFPFGRGAAPRRVNLPFSTGPASTAKFAPGVFTAAPRRGGEADAR